LYFSGVEKDGRCFVTVYGGVESSRSPSPDMAVVFCMVVSGVGLGE